MVARDIRKLEALRGIADACRASHTPVQPARDVVGSGVADRNLGSVQGGGWMWWTLLCEITIIQANTDRALGYRAWDHDQYNAALNTQTLACQDHSTNLYVYHMLTPSLCSPLTSLKVLVVSQELHTMIKQQ